MFVSLLVVVGVPPDALRPMPVPCATTAMDLTGVPWPTGRYVAAVCWRIGGFPTRAPQPAMGVAVIACIGTPSGIPSVIGNGRARPNAHSPRIGRVARGSDRCYLGRSLRLQVHHDDGVPHARLGSPLGRLITSAVADARGARNGCGLRRRSVRQRPRWTRTCSCSAGPSAQRRANAPPGPTLPSTDRWSTISVQALSLLRSERRRSKPPRGW